MFVAHVNNDCGIWNVRSGFQFRGGYLNVSRNKAIIGGFRCSTIIPVIYLHQSVRWMGGSTCIVPSSEGWDNARRDLSKIVGPGLNWVVERCGCSTMQVSWNHPDVEESLIEIHNNLIRTRPLRQLRPQKFICLESHTPIRYQTIIDSDRRRSNVGFGVTRFRRLFSRILSALGIGFMVFDVCDDSWNNCGHPTSNPRHVWSISNKWIINFLVSFLCHRICTRRTARGP